MNKPLKRLSLIRSIILLAPGLKPGVNENAILYNNRFNGFIVNLQQLVEWELRASGGQK